MVLGIPGWERQYSHVFSELKIWQNREKQVQVRGAVGHRAAALRVVRGQGAGAPYAENGGRWDAWVEGVCREPAGCGGAQTCEREQDTDDALEHVFLCAHKTHTSYAGMHLGWLLGCVIIVVSFSLPLRIYQTFSFFALVVSLKIHPRWLYR